MRNDTEEDRFDVRQGGQDRGDPQKEKLFSKVFVLLIVISFFSFMVGQGANTGTTVYLSVTGRTGELAGICAFAFSASAALSRIIAGGFIDSTGRQKVIVFGCALMVLGTFGPVIFNSDPILVIWRILQGIGFASATTAAATSAADVLPFSRLGEGIGYYGLGQAVAMSIGPALAIALIYTDPPENFFLILSLFSLSALLLSLLCRYEKHPDSLPPTSDYRIRWESGQVPTAEGGDREPCANGEDARIPENGTPSGSTAFHRMIDSVFEPKALPGAIPMMVIALSFAFGIFYMGLFGSDIGTTNSGLFFTLSAFSMIMIRLFGSKMMDSIAPIKLMGFAVLCDLITFALLFLCTSIEIDSITEWIFYLAGLPYGMSLGVTLPVNQAISVKLSPPDRWGAANGLYLLCNDIAIGLASALWGITNEVFGYKVTIISIMLIIILSFIVAKVCYPKDL